MCEMQRLTERDLDKVRETEIMAREQRKGDNNKSTANNLDREEEIIELAGQKVELWLKNRFGNPDLIELLIPTDVLFNKYTHHPSLPLSTAQ